MHRTSQVMVVVWFFFLWNLNTAQKMQLKSVCLKSVCLSFRSANRHLNSICQVWVFRQIRHSCGVLLFHALASRKTVRVFFYVSCVSHRCSLDLKSCLWSHRRAPVAADWAHEKEFHACEILCDVTQKNQLTQTFCPRALLSFPLLSMNSQIFLCS